MTDDYNPDSDEWDDPDAAWENDDTPDADPAAPVGIPTVGHVVMCAMILVAMVVLITVSRYDDALLMLAFCAVYDVGKTGVTRGDWCDR